jgi:hypothetical protein
MLDTENDGTRNISRTCLYQQDFRELPEKHRNGCELLNRRRSYLACLGLWREIKAMSHSEVVWPQGPLF